MTNEERIFHAIVAKGIDNAYGAAGAVENLYPDVEVEVEIVDINETADVAGDLPMVRFTITKDPWEPGPDDSLQVKAGMHHTLQTMRNRMQAVLKEAGVKPRKGLAI